MAKKRDLSMDMLKQFLTCSLLLLSLQAMADPTIRQIYENQNLRSTPDMATRMDMISAQFLEKPYMRTALGEGEHGYYDTAPLYRTDAFDCETFVDTVLALAIANNPATFEQCIRKIRYQDGKVSFLYRNHFTCLDWNQNNRKQGFIKDITSTFHDQTGHPIAETAKALIDKPAWYQHFSTDIIRIHNASLAEQEKRLAQLKEKGSRLPRTLSITPYIPLTVLFNKAGEANMDIFNQIPNGAILEIVRPNWDLEQKIGTRLNISHLGFVFRKNGQLIFRAATSSNHRIMDCPLISYLRETRKSPTIRGINIQVVTVPTRLAESVCK